MSKRPIEPWTGRERATLDRLDSPHAIQRFLDGLPYNTDPVARPPRAVLQVRRAHCFDGAMLAAAALRRLGHPPLLVDLRAHDDDDHVLAIFRRDRHYGAVAKSNFVGLRFREPVYRSLRELAMSYFEPYYNLAGLRSLRQYSVPLDLGRFDRYDWLGSDGGVARIERALDSIRHYPLLGAKMIRLLGKLDERSYRAGMVGYDPAGVYQPRGV